MAALVPVFSRLTVAEQDKLLRDMRDLLTTRSWEGAGGLALTEDMRLTIAAQACLLTLAFDGDPYPELKSVLVYPSAFVPAVSFRWARGEAESPGPPELGESWSDGVIVIAWDQAAGAAAQPEQGSNVVLHEFAHQLDAADGTMDGAPPLPAAQYREWARVLARGFRALSRAAWKHHPDVLDTYGTTNPSEFFAVATETFFAHPLQLQREHPELYAELKGYYRQDPVRLLAPGDAAG